MEGLKRKLAICESTGITGQKLACHDTKTAELLSEDKLGEETFHLTNNDVFFPELVWKLVAKKLRTTSDIENCSNSGAFLNQLLGKKRERKIVLPKVFEILAKKFAKSENPSFKETLLESIPWNRPQAKPINPMTGLWKCRLVCKLWNKAIEDLYQQKDVGHFLNRDSKKETPKNCHLLTHAWDYLKIEPNDFLKQFSSTHYDAVNKTVRKNPFLGRGVKFFMLARSAEPVNQHNFVFEILEKWGRELWYCKIDQHRFRDDVDGIRFYRSISQYLKMMPNLKVLHLLYEVKMSDFYRHPDYSALKAEIRQNPLPILPNLVSLACVNLPRPIFKHLMFRNDIKGVCIFTRFRGQEHITVDLPEIL